MDAEADNMTARSATAALATARLIEPADEAGVAAAVREACASGTPVYPIGGGTRLDYGVRPRRPGVGLSLGRLNGLIEYAVQDMTVTVEAGMTLAELARTLAAAGQRLPIDMPAGRRATVGGAVAVDAAGPRRYALGHDPRLRAGAPRGGRPRHGLFRRRPGLEKRRRLQPLPPARRLAGHAGHHHPGDAGRRPLPETSALAACDLHDLAAGRATAGRPGPLGALPVAVELRLRPPHRAGMAARPMPEGSPIRLVAGFEGSGAEVEWMLARLCDQWRRLGVSSLDDRHRRRYAESWWNWLTDFPAELQSSVLPGRTGRTDRPAAQLLPDCCLQAHAGDGLVRVQWSPQAGSGDGLAALVRESCGRPSRNSAASSSCSPRPAITT